MRVNPCVPCSCAAEEWEKGLSLYESSCPHTPLQNATRCLRSSVGKNSSSVTTFFFLVQTRIHRERCWPDSFERVVLAFKVTALFKMYIKTSSVTFWEQLSRVSGGERMGDAQSLYCCPDRTEIMLPSMLMRSARMEVDSSA